MNEEGEIIYSPPQFIRLNSRYDLQFVVDKFNELGYYDINAIMELESMLHPNKKFRQGDTDMAKRGELTAAIQAKALEFWGREITQQELRLYPYVHFCATNSRKMEPAKVNQEERRIMSVWREAGHFEGGASEMNMTKEFFDFINDCLWLGYFAYDSED